MSKELQKKDDYALIAQNAVNMLGQANEDLEGLTVSFPKIKVPAGGGIAFELPDEDTTKEFDGVILYHHPVNVYYEDAYSGGNNPPDCGSLDGRNGYERETNTTKNCASCPLNKFGSGKDGGKACKQKRRLYVLREGDTLPTILTIPTGSLKEFSKYVMTLLNKNLKTATVVTKFSLKKAQNKNGITYSQVVFNLVRALSANEIEATNQMKGLVKEYTQAVTYEILEDEKDDDLPF